MAEGVNQTTITPSHKDIDAWRLEAETAIRFGGVHRLGQFNWPQAVLSLIAELEKHDPSEPLDTPLPCDIRVHGMRFGKGVKLRVFAEAAARWKVLADKYVVNDLRSDAKLRGGEAL